MPYINGRWADPQESNAWAGDPGQGSAMFGQQGSVNSYAPQGAGLGYNYALSQMPGYQSQQQPQQPQQPPPPYDPYAGMYSPGPPGVPIGQAAWAQHPIWADFMNGRLTYYNTPAPPPIQSMAQAFSPYSKIQDLLRQMGY